MSLKLYYHPLASFCWKALIGLYELGIPFEKHVVDLANEAERAELERLWPMVKFPVLRDEAKDETWPESSIVLEYVASLAPDRNLVPADARRALQCRLHDRIYDAYIHQPMQTIVANRLRKESDRDRIAVNDAREQIEKSYSLVESLVGDGPWSLGPDFTLADCSAMPALFYGNKVAPLGGHWPRTAAYLARLCERPSVARVLDDAQPYFKLFPE